jgi:aminopeptidase-like protein
MLQEMPSQQLLIKETAQLFEDLFPICRSLTGDGVRMTMRRLQQIVPFDIKEIKSGTVVYDWTIPDEWNVFGAVLETENGEKIIDFADNNLHLVNYSVAVDGIFSFEELRPHLHTLPACPDVIPYRTSYFTRDWGFCLSYNKWLSLDQTKRYRVKINTRLAPGAMTYAEAILPGVSGKEYLLSSYCCHPSMANDNLSGVITWALLLRHIAGINRRHSYRFILSSETVGTVAYLALNKGVMGAVKGGYVLSCCAGPGKFGYKKSFAQLLSGELADIDRAALLALKEAEIDFIEFPFDVNGSDERQFSAPAWRIPTGTICKDKYCEFIQYHTSADNLDFVKPDALLQALHLYIRAIDNLERNDIFRSLMPFCEPMLRKRDLYPALGGLTPQRSTHPVCDYTKKYERELDALLWTMFFGDGRHDLMAIAEKTGIPMSLVRVAVGKLAKFGLVDFAHENR